MGLIDLLLVVAAILIIIWLLGLVIFPAIGTILYVLLVVAIIVIILRFVFGRRV